MRWITVAGPGGEPVEVPNDCSERTDLNPIEPIDAPQPRPVARDEWFGWLQGFLEARMGDAPDETCRIFARNIWDKTAEFTDDC